MMCVATKRLERKVMDVIYILKILKPFAQFQVSNERKQCFEGPNNIAEPEVDGVERSEGEMCHSANTNT